MHLRVGLTLCKHTIPKIQNKVLLLPLFPIEHWNYLGVDENLGPVAVSLRREKLDEHKEHGQQYNYRVIFRTSEVRMKRKRQVTEFHLKLNISLESLPHCSSALGDVAEKINLL